MTNNDNQQEWILGYPEGGITGPTTPAPFVRILCGDKDDNLTLSSANKWPREIITKGHQTIAIVIAPETKDNYHAPDTEQLAKNAALIAAAPEMADVLLRFCKLYYEGEPGTEDATVSILFSQSFMDAEIALKKAGIEL